MKTNQAERKRWLPELELTAADMEQAEINDILAFTRDLIADVDEATALLEEWMNGKELPPHWTDRVRSFLKEPSE